MEYYLLLKKIRIFGESGEGGLKDKKVNAIVTDFDPKYDPIIKTNFADALHQLCVGHFNNIIDGDLRKAAGLKG